jgi:hypothetical protein
VTCDWPVVYPGDCAALNLVEPLIFEQIATAFLAAWTGYGVCPVVLRPCRSDCGSGDTTFWGYGPYTGGSSAGGRWGPALVNGAWTNVTCGRCGELCSCSGGTEELRLPGPVASVEEVLIDGVALDPGAYRVDNRSLLVRTDGGGWPGCQDMSAPVTDLGTWQVSYSHGTAVPPGGQLAAGVLACELAKGATGDKSCALPQRVQTISRQGVTMTLLDSFNELNQGRTGVWLVDSWVASVIQPRRGGSVRSVDVPSPRHRVTTWP